MKTMKFRIHSYAAALLVAGAVLVPHGAARAQTSPNPKLSPEAEAQREAIRRQEAVLAGMKDLKDAQVMYQYGQVAEAKAIVERLLKTILPGGQGDQLIADCKRLLVQIQLAEARDAFDKKQWLIARDKANAVLQADPGNTAAQELLNGANLKLGIPSDNPSAMNPAVDQKFIDRVNQVTDLLKKGDDYVSTGQFDKAENAYTQALALDPDNSAAARALKAVYAKENLIAETATKAFNTEKLTDTRHNWAARYQVDLLADQDESPVVPIRRSNQFKINQKLKSIIIPKIDFKDASLEDAATFLSLQSRALDPDKEGVSFVVKDKAKEEAKPINLTMQNVPLGEALRYITNLSGVRSKAEEFAVFLVPLNAPQDNLIRREFRVRSDFFDAASADAQKAAAGAAGNRRAPISAKPGVKDAASDTKAALQARGVEFPEGAVAIYSPVTGILTVRNTQEQIDYIEELVTAEGEAEAIMIRIETRVVEINQTDVDALAFNYQLAGNFNPGTGVSGTVFNGTSVGADTHNQTANDLPQNSITQLLRQFPESVTDRVTIPAGSNQLRIGGFLDGNAYSILIDALSQKNSFNTLAAPSVVVLNQATGSINVSRDFRYPTSYDPPVVQNPPAIVSIAGVFIGFAGAPTVIPAWPSGFGQAPGDDGFAEIGVTMSVTPEVQPNNKIIRLTVNPQILAFDGFVNYGIPIRSPIDGAGNRILTDGPFPIINENRIRVPIFSRRSVDQSTVEIQDGYTLVLGGLIGETINTIEDKVPFFGDFPFVGRFFSSKAERSVKQNVMIFVSVRILRPNGDPLNIMPNEVVKAY
jgi:general secretion pathway protein D